MTLKGRSIVIQFLKVHNFLILDKRDTAVLDIIKTNRRKNTPYRFK